jgi:hypothetical protein
MSRVHRLSEPTLIRPSSTAVFARESEHELEIFMLIKEPTSLSVRALKTELAK